MIQTNELIDNLSDQQAVIAVKAIIEDWFQKEGLKAHLIVSQVNDEAQNRNLNFPEEIYVEETNKISKYNGQYAKVLLKELSQADNPNTRDLVRQKLQEANQSTAQVIETIIVTKTILALGFIFLSRVKKVDRSGIEFSDLQQGDIPAIIALATAILIS